MRDRKGSGPRKIIWPAYVCLFFYGTAGEDILSGMWVTAKLKTKTNKETKHLLIVNAYRVPTLLFDSIV